MLEVAARVVLGGVLAGAALAKLARPRASRAGMASFGVAEPRAQWVVWASLIVIELVLAGGVLAGVEAAAFLAAGLMLMFAAAMAAAMLRGRAGAPCGCFGPRSTIKPPAIARNLALAGAYSALPFLPTAELSTDAWLGIGLGLALVVCAGLAVALLALAREVGMLRLRLGPAGALEITEEGPELGSPTPLAERFSLYRDAELALAFFVSSDCAICRSLEPAIASLAREPALAVVVFEESAEPELWEELRIPGSPYAVALELDGRVLAKGTFNNLAQLESVLAAAERRRAARGPVEAVGA